MIDELKQEQNSIYLNSFASLLFFLPSISPLLRSIVAEHVDAEDHCMYLL